MRQIGEFQGRVADPKRAKRVEGADSLPAGRQALAGSKFNRVNIIPESK